MKKENLERILILSLGIALGGLLVLSQTNKEIEFTKNPPQTVGPNEKGDTCFTWPRTHSCMKD